MPETDEAPSLDLAQVTQFIARRRWWILLTACVVALSTIAVALVLPNRYTSEATVLVIQQQVPERYVTPTTTTDVSQALQGMTEEVLSRTRLLSIIDAVGLYPKERNRVAPEKLLEHMRSDIAILPLETGSEKRTVNSFKISFVCDTPQRAQDVTGRLTSLFIQENVKMREHQATVTSDFLEEELQTVKKQLADKEEVVRNFKMQHLGDLPEQEQGNVQILASLSAQLQNAEASVGRAQAQKTYLESLLRGYQDLAAHDTGTVVGPSGEIVANPLDALEKDVARLQAQRDTLLSKYTPTHPDVVAKDAEIAKAQALLDKAKSLPRVPATQKPAHASVIPGRKEDAPMSQVKSQLEQNRVEMENLTKDSEQIKQKIAQYQGRLNSTPVREQQLAGMLRDYELLKLNYADLLKKQTESGLAVSLEKHQEGQQFGVVDSPSLPTVPSSPKRVKICLGGAAVGAALGLALAFFVETRQRPFYSEKQLRESIKVPLVIALPVLLTRGEIRREAWARRFEWVAASVLVLLLLAAEFYVYRQS